MKSKFVTTMLSDVGTACIPYNRRALPVADRLASQASTSHDIK
jgi:hypothetical protein